MTEHCYEELKENKNLRENLSSLRRIVKTPEEKEHLKKLIGDGELLIGLLCADDPKTRKNAALLLGELQLQSSAGSLWTAYEKETTLFVKSAYLTALGKLEVSDYLEVFRQRMDELAAIEPAADEKKHIDGELRELQKIITGIEGITGHHFCGLKQEHTFVLTTNRECRNATLAEIGELAASVRRSTSQHPLGVAVRSKELQPFLSLRTYRELLFPIHTADGITQDAAAAADVASAVWNSDLFPLLLECHREGAPFYFRLELKGTMPLDQKSNFAKRFSSELERLSGRKLINSTGDYELEIRLIEKKDGGYAPFARLCTVPVKRFSYRKHAISASIHPATAALLVQLAKPYLKENAQILDPFCGVGTMLIERDARVPAAEIYGIDLFGEAVRMARENAEAAEKRIHFINRDFFRFEHDYLFDEIITDMPAGGKQSREETDALYARFFVKAKELLKAGGTVILYTNEVGFLKKQLRLQSEFHLIREFEIRKKEHRFLYVIGFRK